ncbi:MAG: hypothetical protein ABI863_00490 [Ginsengibacter sp.]
MPIDYLKSLKNWSSNEIAVYESKHAGLPFGKLSRQQLKIAVTGIALNISVITGCQLPIDQRHIDSLDHEISKFLTDNRAFSTLTFEEIMMAFRFNAAGKLDEKVKHWNNILNLDYLGEVLNLWVKLRDVVEKKAEDEEIKSMLSLPTLPCAKIPNNEMIEIARHIWNFTSDYKLIPHRAYDLLLKQGLINLSEEEKTQIKKAAKADVNEIFNGDDYLSRNSNRETWESRVSKQIAVAKWFDQESKHPEECQIYNRPHK